MKTALYLECSLICFGYCYGALGHRSLEAFNGWSSLNVVGPFALGYLHMSYAVSVCRCQRHHSATEARLKKLEAAAVAFHRLNKIYVHSFICGNGKRACTSRAPCIKSERYNIILCTGWIFGLFLRLTRKIFMVLRKRGCLQVGHVI